MQRQQRRKGREADPFGMTTKEATATAESTATAEATATAGPPASRKDDKAFGVGLSVFLGGCWVVGRRRSRCARYPTLPHDGAVRRGWGTRSTRDGHPVIGCFWRRLGLAGRGGGRWRLGRRGSRGWAAG